VRRPLTTRCCSAIALTLFCGCAIAARKSPSGPRPFFPVRSVWTLALNNAITAPPLFSGANGYFPIEGDRLVAYDLATGTQLWIVPATIESAPAAGDGLIFLAEPGAIAALRESDGGVQWHLPYDKRLAVPLVWDNGWLIAADTSGRVTAFRGTDGHQIWRRDIGAQIHAPPALAADLVYISAADSRLIALRVNTGAPVWEHRLGGAPNDILALDDRVYVGSDDNYFYCVSATKGDILWRWPTGADVIGKPAIDARHVYFVSLDNVLRSLDRKTGAQIWKRALPMRPTAGPLLAADAVIVTGIAPAPRAFLTKDGTPAPDLPAGGVVAAPPAIITVPGEANPFLIVMATDIAKGSTVMAMTRSIDPAVAPSLSPLPNPVMPPPTLPQDDR
jgi:outer membrane protein assembly factor BamB